MITTSCPTQKCGADCKISQLTRLHRKNKLKTLQIIFTYPSHTLQIIYTYPSHTIPHTLHILRRFVYNLCSIKHDSCFPYTSDNHYPTDLRFIFYFLSKNYNYDIVSNLITVIFTKLNSVDPTSQNNKVYNVSQSLN